MRDALEGPAAGQPVTHESDVRGRRRVLVGLHGRRAPLGAIGMARLIAEATRCPLHGLFVWSTPLPASDVPRLLRLTPEALEGMILDVEVGETAERLARASRETPTSFVVLAVESEKDATDELGVGDVGSRFLRETTAAAVVMRPGAAPPARLRRILLPLDGTPSTASAIAPVGELARDAGASLDIVVVAAGAPKPPEPGEMAPPMYCDQPQHEWAAFSNEFLERFLGAIGHCPKEVPTRLFLGAGNPAQEILRFADQLESDLVGLVWHGHLEDHHGEVFRDVLRASRRPVLVIRR